MCIACTSTVLEIDLFIRKPLGQKKCHVPKSTNITFETNKTSCLLEVS